MFRKVKLWQKKSFLIKNNLWCTTGGKSLVSVFQEIFASINKIFILAGKLGTRLSL